MHICYAGVANLDSCANNNLKNVAFQHHLSFHRSEKFVFSDGSKFKNSCGASAVMDNIVLRKKLNDNYNSLDAELYGIKLALEYILSEDRGNQDYVIFTDCEMAMRLMLENTLDNSIVKENRKIIEQIHNNITLCKISDHCRIPGNEMADEAAKRVALMDDAYGQNFKKGCINRPMQ